MATLRTGDGVLRIRSIHAGGPRGTARDVDLSASRVSAVGALPDGLGAVTGNVPGEPAAR